MTGERLTARQEEVLRLSAMMTDKEIGRALGISENTVDKHFREILRKCGVHNRKAALRQLAPETSYATAAVPPAPPAMPDPGIGEAPSLPPPFPVPPSRLPAFYLAAGRWRTPGSIRVRAIAILFWLVTGLLVLLALTGVTSAVLGAIDGFAPVNGTMHQRNS